MGQNDKHVVGLGVPEQQGMEISVRWGTEVCVPAGRRLYTMQRNSLGTVHVHGTWARGTAVGGQKAVCVRWGSGNGQPTERGLCTQRGGGACFTSGTVRG